MPVSVEFRSDLLPGSQVDSEIEAVSARDAFWTGVRAVLLEMSTVRIDQAGLPECYRDNIELCLREVSSAPGADEVQGVDVMDRLTWVANSIKIVEATRGRAHWTSDGIDRTVKGYEADADRLLRQAFADSRVDASY